MENVLDNVIDSELTGNEPGAIEVPEGKTFSQEDVNKIINERLKKEKDKTQKQVEAMEKEFKQKELNLKAKELLTSKGLSLDILDALKYEDEETLKKSVSIVESIIDSIPPQQNEPAQFKGITPAVSRGIPGSPNPNDQIREAFGLKK